MEIYTIGHSVHTKDMFIDMLNTAHIDAIVDVRAFPASRKFPQFNQETMKKWLNEAGFDYYHLRQLAGRRNQSRLIQEELNDGWRNQSFHNYADYTLTSDFQDGIKQLYEIANKQTVALCCAERHPSRCHRLLISNWLQANGCKVKHIIDGPKDSIDIITHTQGKWGALPIIEGDGKVVYPEL